MQRILVSLHRAFEYGYSLCPALPLYHIPTTEQQMLLHLLRMRCEIEILQKYKYKLAGTMQFRRTASPKLYLPISDACPQKSELQCRKIGTLFQFAKNYTISSNRLSPIATHCHFTKSRESCYRAYPSATQTKHTRINNKKIKGGTTTKMRLQS